MLFRHALLLPAVLAVVAPTPPAKAPPVITFHAKDYAYVAPKTVPSGPVTFRLVNDGKELHHMTIVKLGKGKTLKDFAESVKKPGPPPSWTTEVGGPNPAAPGGAVEATLSLEPGEYAIVCFINTPGEEAPHMTKGMMSGFTVTPEASGATAPASDVSINLSDYKFTFSKPLSLGKHQVNVINDAAQPHEIVMVKLDKGKTVADLARWVDRDLLKGPPPGMPVGGIAALAKGRSGSFPLDLGPGTYGLVCFYPDMKDGKPHSTHGMTTQFTLQ